MIIAVVIKLFGVTRSKFQKKISLVVFEVDLTSEIQILIFALH